MVGPDYIIESIYAKRPIVILREPNKKSNIEKIIPIESIKTVEFK